MNWHYHDPGKGRVGPLSAEEMRARYMDRRIQSDTLVWREGMREWQPLDRVADELDLLGVKPDAAAPPPLPPGPPAGVGAPVYAATPGAPEAVRMPPGAMRAPPRRGMSGCLIALIVVAVLAVPIVAILAAIALPAYQDYTVRAKVAQQIDTRAPAIQSAVLSAMAAHTGRCPESAADAGLGDTPNVDFGAVDGRCAFRVRVQGINSRVDGQSVIFVAPASPDGAWDCTGGDLPAKYRYGRCRSEASTTP